ncbi:MAG: metal ABC transporter ATP-binding protein [Clostridia bacterium]|nr:metal ABC transporter ATP-binding protein [Clostridia bacterium]
MTNNISSNNKNSKSCGLCCTKIEDFSVIRGGTRILDDINIHIHCGELTALIGPNGAGKSTLLKAVLGEIKHKGELKFLDEKGVHTGHPVIGYVPQQLSFDRSSPVSVLDLFAACKSKIPVWLSRSKKLRSSVSDALERVQAEYAIDRKLGALSGGELQRVLLALALDPVPDILLLDEPVSGIDYCGMEMFYNTVSELRKSYDMTIILVSHDLPLVSKFADHVIFLNRTIICSGSPKEVFSHPRAVETFGYFHPADAEKRKGGSED